MSAVFTPGRWLSRQRGDQAAQGTACQRTQRALLGLVRVDSVSRIQAGHGGDFQGVDWSYLQELAYREGMAPLVYDTLSRTSLGGMVEVQAQRYHYFYQLARRRYAGAAAQLREALDRLDSDGIEGIVLKGAALMGRVYPDPGLRPFADIDILVRHRDISRAHRALVDLGYGLNYQGKPVPEPSQTDIKYRSARQYFRRDPGCLSIDLYWRLDRYPYLVPLDYEGLWRRAERVALEGTSALVLSPADAVLHHSLDFTLGVCYGQPELKGLRDIAEIAQRQEVDWDLLASLAGRSALAAPLYYSCALARELLGAPVPQDALVRIFPGAGRGNSPVLDRLEAGIFGGGHPAKYGLIILLMRLSGPESYGAKLSWLARLLVPPRQLWGNVPDALRRALVSRAV